MQILKSLEAAVNKGLADGIFWVESSEEASASSISGPVYRTSNLEELHIVMSECNATILSAQVGLDLVPRVCFCFVGLPFLPSAYCHLSFLFFPLPPALFDSCANA